MLRPRIKRTAESIEDPDGNIVFLRPSLRSEIEFSGLDQGDRRLLAALDGTRTLEELRSEFGEASVDSGLDQLDQMELLEDGADDDLLDSRELKRFDRQLRYFSDIRSPDGDAPSEYQERLRNAHVAVLGVGGLGSWAAWALACCGLGHLRLVDSDRVELSNLNRQVLYTEGDIGRRKVDVAANRLRAFNSSMQVTSVFKQLNNPAEIVELVDGADVVVNTADVPAHDFDHWCNEACFSAGIPFITMSHFPPIARVGPLFVPGVTGCYACQEIAWRRAHPKYDLIVEQRRAKPQPAATLGPACGMVGTQVGMEILHFLTGLAEPSTLGMAYISDLRTMEVEAERVIPEPTCRVCSELEHTGVLPPGADNPMVQPIEPGMPG